MMDIFLTVQCQEVITYWQNSSNLDDVGIVDVPLYAIILNFHNEIGSMEEDKQPEDSSIWHTGTLFLLEI